MQNNVGSNQTVEKWGFSNFIKSNPFAFVGATLAGIFLLRGINELGSMGKNN
jgi:hypothetical protein